jgi:hypothetical protein
VRYSQRLRSEAEAFHAEGHPSLWGSALMSLAAVIVLGVISALISLAHLP